MRKYTSLGLALCGALLLVLFFILGRMLFIKLHVQSFAQIAGREPQQTLVLTENETVVRTETDGAQIAAVTALLDGCTYTEYPHFFRPNIDELTADRLTVTLSNGHSISVDAQGYVLVNGKLRGIQDGRGQELYHKLFVLFYPTKGE